MEKSTDIECPKFLLLPMQPTPNGRLHLGHLSGPYLNCDVLGRLLKRSGAEVTTICGADVYENWVIPPADAAKLEVGDFCTKSSDQIESDLAAFNISIDTWINPLSVEHTTGYNDANNELLRRGQKSGSLILKEEKVPYNISSGKLVSGVWLIGRCPGCGESASGNCCESCGYHYQPDEILDPKERHSDSELEWKFFKSWFTKPDGCHDISLQIRDLCQQRSFCDLGINYAKQKGQEIRLTSPEAWGIPNTVDGFGTTVSNTFYGYCYYCAEVYAQTFNCENPLSQASSNVRVIAFAGIDNLVAAIVAPLAISGAVGTRPFDTVNLNKFLTLDGQKFSTSRKHGVWLSELIELELVHPDEVRLYIASISNPEFEVDFNLKKFVEFINVHRRTLKQRINTIAATEYKSNHTSCYRCKFDCDFSIAKFSLESVFANYWKFVTSDPTEHCRGSWASTFLHQSEALMPILGPEIYQLVQAGGSPDQSVVGHKLLLNDLRTVIHHGC